MTTILAAVGIGNTSVKFGRASEVRPESLPVWTHLRELSTRDFHPAELENATTHLPHGWYVVSVHRAAEQRLREWVARNRPRDQYRLLHHDDLRLEIDVEFPDRVGMDRLTAAVAVNRLRNPDRAAVFIDAGTALTVNLVTSDGIFRGGVILPGFRLTSQALASGTDLLPLVAPDLAADPPPVVGRSTEAAIRSGLFWGNIGAVRELIQRMTSELTAAPEVFVTGGDAQRLTSFLSPDAHFVPDLVLIGVATAAAAIQHD